MSKSWLKAIFFLWNRKRMVQLPSSNNVAVMAQACIKWSEVMQIIQTGSKVFQLLTQKCSRIVTGSHWNEIAVTSPSPLEPERVSVTGLDQLCTHSSAHKQIRKTFVIFLTGVVQRQTSGHSRNMMYKGKPASTVSKICVRLKEEIIVLKVLKQLLLFVSLTFHCLHKISKGTAPK